MTRQLAEPVETCVDGPVATVTVGTGRKRNALSTAAWRRLESEMATLSDEPSLRAVLVRGAAGTFCAGSDMTEWAGAAPEEVEESFAAMEAAFRAVEACPVPVVAEIRGVAAGAGCQLALACDLRVMAESARIGMPIARLGILAGPAFAARLSRLAGPELTGELLYTGRLMDAGEAVTARMAGAAVPDAQLDVHIRQLMTRITTQNATAVRAAKRSITAATGPLPDPGDDPAVSYSELQQAVETFLSRHQTSRTSDTEEVAHRID